MTPEMAVTPDWRDQRIAGLEKQLREAQATIAVLKGRIAKLEQRLAESEQVGKRQATPFARDEHKADPKKPGRRAGQGRFAYREKPTPEQVDETKEEPLRGCPACGGPLTDVKEHEQFVVDLPEVRPQITRVVTESGYCSRCGRRVRSRPPQQISEASGAAGVMIGPRAKALTADRKHRLGVLSHQRNVGRRGAEPDECVVCADGRVPHWDLAGPSVANGLTVYTIKEHEYAKNHETCTPGADERLPVGCADGARDLWGIGAAFRLCDQCFRFRVRH